MSFELVGLGRLLSTMYATKSERTSALRTDLRREAKKVSGTTSKKKGGDFYGPFWADAKHHVSGDVNLREVTPVRIESNKTRERLYPLLQEGFLLWWEEKRRLRNLKFTVIDENVKARYDAADLGTVKVENTLSFKIGDDDYRVVYPYFCEDPSLSQEAARLGLWVMSQCISDYGLKDLRVLDVLKSRSFSILDTPLDGNEERLFLERYRDLLDEWKRLKPAYF